MRCAAGWRWLCMARLEQRSTSTCWCCQTLGYTIRGKDLSFKGGAIEIRRISKIDRDSGDLLSLDLLLVTPVIEDVWKTRFKTVWENHPLSVVSRKGLIALKSLRSSGQDIDDIRKLQSGRTTD
jgi:hypothetical protein